MRKELGWQVGIFNSNGGKPKGMHWKTYWRLYPSYNTHLSQALEGIGVKLGLTMKHLEKINLPTAHL